MSHLDFSEFDPSAWQEDGLLTGVPRAKKGWLGTRATNLVNALAVAVPLAVAAFTTLQDVRAAQVDEAATQVAWGAPFKPADRGGTADAVPAGYWQAMHEVVARWPVVDEPLGAPESEPLF